MLQQHKTARYARSSNDSESTYTVSTRRQQSVKKQSIKKKWTLKDIRKHQDKMSDGIVPWEEVWEVPGKYSAQEYYNLMDEDCHWELIDNKILVHSPAGMEHQDIVGSLYALIRTHVTVKGWGIAYTAPAGLEINGLNNKFEPDIFAISQDKARFVKGSYCEYVPELVIEVALTKKALNYIIEKKHKKFVDYASIGIIEYLVIYAPKKGSVQYYHYENVNGEFHKKTNEDIVHLQTIDLTFPSELIKDREYWRQSIIDEFLGSTVVQKIDPKIRVNGVDPKVRVNGVDPKVRVGGIPPETLVEYISQKELAYHMDPIIRVDGVDPKVRVNGVDPKVRVDGVDPKVRVNGVDPKVRVDGVDPKVRLDGLDAKTKLDSMNLEDIKRYLAEHEMTK
jgi:Uma2 family endonuclease